MSFLGKLFGKKDKETLDQGLEKTKKGFLERISKAIIGKTSVDD
jgi:fused signal recognition particle receptor